MAGLGRHLILWGVILVAAGLVLSWAPRIPFLGFLGRLPGDIRIERPAFRFYFPVTTSILVSIAVTLLVRLLFRK